ncbi:MAG TPA: energy-dependent translational throttle protein EttA [Elusimicrobiota bacterium]|nr:energy-dependent translational throttle protein EttA [Elusimicrobiota bacterium]
MATTVDTKQIIYSMIGVGRIHPPKKQVLKDIYVSFYYGAKIGVLGDNGSGKSTLLRIMAGIDKDYTGEITQSKGYTVGILEQEPQLDKTKTVKEVVEEGVAEIKSLLKEYDAINEKLSVEVPPEEMEKLLEKQGKLQEKIEACGAWELDNKLEVAMDALRCPPPDAKVEHISGGERRRVALCRLLLQEPDILLLDEPTNHLDAESVEWLEQHLRQYKGTIIAVTHDRYFLDNVAGWILELFRGEGIPWKGNYASWLEQKQARLAQEEKSESKFHKSLAKELEWVRMGAKGRQAKSKARLKAYDAMLEESPDKKESELEIYIPPGPRLGENVIEAKGVSKAYGDKLLFENLSFKLPPNGIVGVIGPNGAGKTTLFKLISGKEKPDAGTFKVGESVKLSYVDQDRSTLDPDKNIWEAISDGLDVITLGKKEIQSRQYVARFNFSGSDQQKFVKDLSGGERNRVHLARMLREGGNVLLLDEPTNDLDVHTLRALEEALDNFGGCAVVISHDRWFLDRIATHILAFEGDSQVRFFEGNYTDYEEDRKRRLGDAAQPHRIHYKKLTRS